MEDRVVKLTFSQALLKEAAGHDFIEQKPAIDNAKRGDTTLLSKYVAHITFRKFFQTYRARGGLWVCLRRVFGSDPDYNDALTASWEVLSNTAFTFEVPHGC